MEHASEQQPTAQQQYEENHGILLDTLAAIKHKLDTDHRDGQPKTWADVGNQQHAIEVLENLALFLRVVPDNLGE